MRQFCTSLLWMSKSGRDHGQKFGTDGGRDDGHVHLTVFASMTLSNMGIRGGIFCRRLERNKIPDVCWSFAGRMSTKKQWAHVCDKTGRQRRQNAWLSDSSSFFICELRPRLGSLKICWDFSPREENGKAVTQKGNVQVLWILLSCLSNRTFSFSKQSISISCFHFLYHMHRENNWKCPTRINSLLQ